MSNPYIEAIHLTDQGGRVRRNPTNLDTGPNEVGVEFEVKMAIAETDDLDGPGQYEAKTVLLVGPRSIVVNSPLFFAVDRESAEIMSSRFMVDIY